MIRWQDHVALPAMRSETHFGRSLRCFAERPRSLHAMFALAAEREPAREAICFNGQRWTYADAVGEVDRLAGGLAALGVTRGDRVVDRKSVV